MNLFGSTKEFSALVFTFLLGSIFPPAALGQQMNTQTFELEAVQYQFPKPTVDAISGYFSRSLSFDMCSGRNEICDAEEAPCKSAKTRSECAKLCLKDYSCISFEWFSPANEAHGCQMSRTCTGRTGGSRTKDWELYLKTWRSDNDGKDYCPGRRTFYHTGMCRSNSDGLFVELETCIRGYQLPAYIQPGSRFGVVGGFYYPSGMGVYYNNNLKGNFGAVCRGSFPGVLGGKLSTTSPGLEHVDWGKTRCMNGYGWVDSPDAKGHHCGESGKGRVFTVTNTVWHAFSPNSLAYALRYMRENDRIEFKITPGRDSFVNPESPWAYEIRCPAGKYDPNLESYYQNTYMKVKYPGIVFDGSKQSLNGLRREPGDNRPKIIFSGHNRQPGIRTWGTSAWGGSVGMVVEAAAHHFVMKGIGIVGYPSHGLLVYGRSPHIVDGYFTDNGNNGIYLGSDAEAATLGSELPGSNPLLVSGNKGTAGIVVLAGRAMMFHLLVGTDHTGLKSYPNARIGVHIGEKSMGTIIGSLYKSITTVISGNLEYGIMLSSGQGCQVFGTYVGVGIDGKTALPNDLGIFVNSAPFDSAVVKIGGDLQKFVNPGASVFQRATIIGNENVMTIIAGNAKYGIYSTALNTRLIGETFVGLAKDGVTAVPNRDGVYIGGSSSYLGPGVIVSGNSVRGVYISAEAVLVDNVRVGVSQDGMQTVANGADGLFVAESAMAGVVVKGGIFSGNGRSGIFADAAYLRIENTLLGLAADGKSPLANTRYGLEIGEFGKAVVIGPNDPGTCVPGANAKTVAGRYVRITGVKNTYLNLQELEGFGLNSGKLTPSSASLSTDHSTGYGANNCIDGDAVGGKVCHTGSGDRQWLQVDYGRTVEIAEVVITNRVDTHQDRIEGAIVTISTDKDGMDVVWSGTLPLSNLAVYKLSLGCTK